MPWPFRSPQLSRAAQEIDPWIAAQAIVLAAVANTFAKGGIVLAAGHRALRLAILPGYLLMMIAGVAVAFLI
jgi:uncharacterized membrane protein (DUF4010 family)